MIIISHRGNTKGSDPINENRPDIILKTLEDFDCEIDLWVINNNLFLGHDEPQYAIDEDFLSNKGLWIHAKNLEALDWLYNTSLNYFWHETDKVTITSHGYIWCYPGIFLESGITVLQNRKEYLPEKILGICTDYPSNYIKAF